MVAEGLWTIQFSKTEEFYENLQVGEQINRGGTFVLINNKVFGGGISYYFTGSYEVGGSTISMTITASRYNDLVQGPFGDVTEGNISFKGMINNNKMELHGYLENDMDKMIYIYANKQAEI
jgi:hypothetical protein